MDKTTVNDVKTIFQSTLAVNIFLNVFLNYYIQQVKKYSTRLRIIDSYKVGINYLISIFCNQRTNGPVNAHLRSAAYTNKHV